MKLVFRHYGAIDRSVRLIDANCPSPQLPTKMCELCMQCVVMQFLILSLAIAHHIECLYAANIKVC